MREGAHLPVVMDSYTEEISQLKNSIGTSRTGKGRKQRKKVSDERKEIKKRKIPAHSSGVSLGHEDNLRIVYGSMECIITKNSKIRKTNYVNIFKG